MSDLKRVVTLAELMVKQQALVEQLKKDLQQGQEALRRIEQEDLPELMRELGLNSFVLADGNKVEVVDEVDCSITEDRRASAHAWLSEHGFGGLIKTEVVVAFGRGEHDAAEELAETVAATGHNPEVIERVHPATLKSFIKEQMAAGHTVPFDTFGIRPYSKAKLKKG